MSKYAVFRVLYLILVVLWLVQAAVAGVNEWLILPTVCLVACYFIMKSLKNKN